MHLRVCPVHNQAHTTQRKAEGRPERPTAASWAAWRRPRSLAFEKPLTVSVRPHMPGSAAKLWCCAGA